jgi:CRISPR/Cas system endoribonuclease Cas6 (RAMP superfamily)
VADIPNELGLEMYAEREVPLPTFTGYVCRGLLLVMMKGMNSGEAQEMHELQVQKPYSVTPLRFKPRARTSEGYVLDPTYPCSVKFRFLEDGQIQKVINYFTERSDVLIYDTAFKVASLQVRSRARPGSQSKIP